MPAHWRPDVQAWYAAILESWEFGAAGLQLLLHAGECLNLELECRDAITPGRVAGGGARRQPQSPPAVASVGVGARAVSVAARAAEADRMTFEARRRVHSPALPPSSVVDVLLSGWSGRPIEDDEASCFEVFSLTEAALAEIWRQHRAALLAEASRRGVKRIWAIEQGFDA